MCGVIAYLSNTSISHTRFITKSIQGILSRGYDSIGVMRKLGVSKSIVKSTSNPQNFGKQLADYEHEIMIGHTRWATNGKVSIENTHPHVDSSSLFAIVHNGIITNCEDIRKEYKMNELVSDTDTEVVVQLLSIEYKKIKNIEHAFQTTISKLEGSWAIVAVPLFIQESTFLVHCNDMPLVVSTTKEITALASESTGLPFVEGTYARLPNNTICVITRKKFIESALAYTHFVNKEVPDHEHHTIGEIREQPRLIREFSCPSSVELGHFKHLVLIGCGSSLFAANIATYEIRRTKRFVTVHTMDGSNFDINDIPNCQYVLICFLSQSGETKELLNIARDVCDVKTKWCIVNNPNSTLPTLCDTSFDMKLGKEIGVASTKSVTCQILYLQNIFGIRLDQRALSCLAGDAHAIIEEAEIVSLSPFPNNLFILGNKERYGVAQEVALKLKELCYIHAEAFANNALRHGPFTLLTPKTLCIIIDDGHIENIKNQICARECPIVFIPFHENPLMQLMYSQVLCYRIAVEQMGHNPDYPKNIAKVVSVD